MKFRIPFTFASLEKLKKRSRIFQIKKENKSDKALETYFENAEVEITPQEYRAIKKRTFLSSFILLYIITNTLLFIFKIEKPFLISLGVLLISFFIYFIQTNYPKVHDKKRVRNIERNLIPALEDMLVQLNSGIPLFNILVNISSSDYGSLSDEFEKAVKQINAGLPEIEVLEKLGEKNASILFKRTLWQISNSMRAGSDVNIVIKESVKSLNEEQIIQIQNYGNKLNPLIMFYLLVTVILPALAITFLTIISSMINLAPSLTTVLFISIFMLVILLQILSLGMVKTARPSLL